MQRAGAAKARLFVYLNEHQLKILLREKQWKMKTKSLPMTVWMDSVDMSYDCWGQKQAF